MERCREEVITVRRSGEQPAERSRKSDESIADELAASRRSVERTRELILAANELTESSYSRTVRMILPRFRASGGGGGGSIASASEIASK